MKNTNTYTLTKASMLLAIALLFQFIKMGQYFTGVGINATLIIAASICGVGWAVAIGALTPFFAVVLGVLPPAIFPIVPFIILSNILYVVVFHYIKNKSELAGIIVGALVKFGLLYTIVNYFITKIPAPIKLAMSFPQLITALAGGFLAVVILKVVKHLQKK